MDGASVVQRVARRRKANRREAEVDSISKWHITLRIPEGYSQLVPADAHEEGERGKQGESSREACTEAGGGRRSKEGLWKNGMRRIRKLKEKAKGRVEVKMGRKNVG
ncbi:hypothetical protein E2C01_064132 [Portunus trituberculatus]|uniref:Uncharacterized protein n=1 Tax=Portunus trituberculatus TaxID=210409 RepID=A0A5B7HJI6_PORTR|nr:hypothetical protein [Portunus trituberculatus]